MVDYGREFYLVLYADTARLASHNPAVVAFKELFNILKDAVQPGLKFHQRLAYIFAPPGYSHDGSRKGSKALKAEYVAAHPEQAGMEGLKL